MQFFLGVFFLGNTREIKVAEKPVKLPDVSPANLVHMGNITELTAYRKKPGAPPVRRIDNDHYEYIPTGEVFEYEHIERRSEWKQGIRRTLAHIRALVNTNVTIPQNCRWVTLTYAENMTDTKRLYQDFKVFWLRFCRWCKSHGHGRPEYICVVEPQGRGAWHAHLFIIWDEAAPYIDNNAVMEKLWPHGWTKTKAVTNCDNVGAYFSAYLADIPLDELEKLSDEEQVKALEAGELVTKEFTNEDGLTKSKRFVKGGRLYLYPANMQIIRKSKGIKEPESEQMTLGEAKKKVSSAKLTFSRTYEVRDTSGGASGADGVSAGRLVNIICKEYYNSKRK